MSLIAIITARGGSKRIPKKNIKEFCGKPIIAYSIEAALQCKEFDEVMVSTDNKGIADIALYYGAKIPFFRSAETSNDFATTEDVLIEVLDKYQDVQKYFGIVCCIYPTAPFLTAQKIQNALKLLMDNPSIDSIVPVVKFSYPPQRALVVRDEKLVYQYPTFAKMRSQDLEPIYHDCGQFYMCRESALRKYRDLITPKSIPFVMPEEEVQDIDTYSDWVLAEVKYKTINNM